MLSTTLRQKLRINSFHLNNRFISAKKLKKKAKEERQNKNQVLNIDQTKKESIPTPESWLNAEKVNSVIPQNKLAPGLYVTGTPIGNLSDLTIRGLHILKSVDYICCEDTRMTQKLLTKYGIKKRLLAYHEHSSKFKADSLVSMIKEGKSLAMVTDAGMPTVSDPGTNLVNKMQESNLPVFCVPGPSAVVSALSMSGFTGTKFIFEGFLPRTKSDRQKHLKSLKDISINHHIIFFESKHRIIEALSDCLLIWGETHEIVVVRELTKLHEQIIIGNLKVVLEKVSQNCLGEFTVVIRSLHKSLEQESNFNE